MAAIAENTLMTRYMALQKALTDHHRLGADQLKKHDVMPFLLEHQDFANRLTTYRDLRKQTPAPEKTKLAKARSEVLDSGKRFQNHTADFVKKLEHLKDALDKEVRPKLTTQREREDFGKLWAYLDKTQNEMEHQWANKNLRLVEGMVDKVEASTPIR